MPTPKKGARLGGSPAHQRLIVSNLATALFEHGRITTTEAKARVLRPVAEKLITKAKKAEADLHNRREVLKTIHDKSVVHTLFTEIAPTFAERPGGYTRITKIGPRKGDNAPMAVIELVTESYTPSAPKKKATKKAAAAAAARPSRSSSRPRRPPPPRSRRPTRPARPRSSRPRPPTSRPPRPRARPSAEAAPSRVLPRTESPRSLTGRGARGRHQGLTPTRSQREARHHGRGGGPSWLSGGGSAVGGRRGGRARGVRRSRPRPTRRRPASSSRRGCRRPRRCPGTGVARLAGGRPSGPEVLGHVATGQHEAVLVAADLRRAASRTCGSAPSSRNSPPASCRVTSPVFRSRIPIHSRRPSPPPSTTSAHSRIADPGDVLHLADQVVRHRGRDVGSSYEQGDRAGVPRQVQRRLAGRVATADDEDVAVLHLQRGADRGAVVHAEPDELLDRVDARAGGRRRRWRSPRRGRAPRRPR